MIRFIFIVILLVSCGSDNASNGNNQNIVTPQKEIENNPNIDTYDQDRIYSIALDSSDELPNCDETNDKQLVYIIESQTFYTCQNNEWSEIEIKGQNGKDGKNGENGQNGIEPAKKWLWKDANQNLTYKVMGFFKYQNYTNKYNLICANGFRLPSISEFETAIDNGMLDYFIDLDFIYDGITANDDDLTNLKFWLRDTMTPKTTYYLEGSSNSIDYAEDNQIINSSGFAICIKE